MAFSLTPLFFFVAGALLPLSFAPLAVWPLAILSPLCWLWLSHTQLEREPENLKSFLFKNFLYWFGFYSVGVSWVYVSIHDYGYTPAPLAALLALIFASGLAAVNGIHAFVYWKFKLRHTYLLAFPASWVLLEWLRSWLLTGFPWLYSGYALIDSPLAGFATVGGVYSLSFVAVWIAALLFYVLLNVRTHTGKALLAGSTITLIFIAGFLLGQHHWFEIKKEQPLNVYLVQGNIAQHEKWLPENRQYIINTYIQLVQETLAGIAHTHEKNPQQTHLIVLPEAAMPVLQSELDWLFEYFDEHAKQLNTALISGIFYDENGEGFSAKNIYNSILAIGVASGLYHKQRLVPFGEYVPLENFIRGWIPFFDLPYSSFARGQFGQAGIQLHEVSIAPFICYEILYPELVFAHARNADYLLTISNDAWFGNSWGPAQHFQMARMRALEQGKFLIRNTNTGTTAIIAPNGTVVSAAPKNIRTVLTGEVYPTRGQTPFSRWGHTPILVISALLIMMLATLSYLRRTP